MRFRSVLLASVCAALLAAPAAVAAVAAAEKTPEVIAVETAYRALVSGRATEAIAGFTEAIESRKLAPELLANALLNRALAHQNMGEHQEAVDDYTAAMRVDALSGGLRAVALYNRGLSQQKLEKPALAIEDFTSALFLDIHFAQAYYSRAEVLRRNGQYLFALHDYEQALKQSHREPYLIHYGEALTYEALKRPLLAQQSLMRAIAANPEFEAARRKLAELSGGEADPAKAPTLDKPVLNPAEESVASLSQSADEVVTGSLGGQGPDLVMRREKLPEPEGPPADMLGVDQHLEATAPVKQAALETPEEQAESEAEPAKEAAVEAEPEAAPAPKLSGWMVQLSSQRDEQTAWKVWNRLTARHGKLLKGHEAAVMRADLGAKGIYYRLRVHGLASRGNAQKLCSRLKAKGLSCFVVTAEG